MFLVVYAAKKEGERKKLMIKNSNIIFIVVDALRPDFLSCYGYKKNSTPHIDSIAENGCIFTNAITLATVTPVIFGSLFTGVYPFQHGMRAFSYIMDYKQATIAEIFAKNGYKTGAIVGSVVIDKSRRFNRGFEYYNDIFDVQGFYNDRKVIPDPQNAFIFRFGEVITEYGKDWIVKNRHNKFMLFLHYWDAHSPYTSPKRFLRQEILDYKGIIDGSIRQIEEINSGKIEMTDNDREQIRGLYEGGVINVDRGVGKILDTLKRLDLIKNTTIIITSDHGESLGEHNYIGHGRLLYENIIKTPLIISGPMTKGVKNKKIDALVSNNDIFPTIMNGFGFEKGDHVKGQDMNLLIGGIKKELRKFTYSETYFPRLIENKRIAFRSNEWKLIREPHQKRIKETLKNKIELLNTFVYRYRKNKQNRLLLKQKLWDKIIMRKSSSLSDHAEQALIRQRKYPRELYNLKDDPNEKINLYYSRPDVATKYENLLKNFLDSYATEDKFAEESQDKDIIEKLKSLGYI